MNKKLLITSGASFIGLVVIRHLIQNADWDVVNPDKLISSGNLDSLAEVSDRGCDTFDL
jgi:dTDP-glucose 4,6-dehydratase